MSRQLHGIPRGPAGARPALCGGRSFSFLKCYVLLRMKSNYLAVRVGSQCDGTATRVKTVTLSVKKVTVADNDRKLGPRGIQLLPRESHFLPVPRTTTVRPRRTHGRQGHLLEGTWLSPTVAPSQSGVTRLGPSRGRRRLAALTTLSRDGFVRKQSGFHNCSQVFCQLL